MRTHPSYPAIHRNSQTATWTHWDRYNSNDKNNNADSTSDDSKVMATIYNSSIINT